MTMLLSPPCKLFPMDLCHTSIGTAHNAGTPQMGAELPNKQIYLADKLIYSARNFCMLSFRSQEAWTKHCSEGPPRSSLPTSPQQLPCNPAMQLARMKLSLPAGRSISDELSLIVEILLVYEFALDGINWFTVFAVQIA